MRENAASSTTRPSMHDAPYYVRALAMALPAMMLGWQISGWIFFLPSALAGRADFRPFYTAGYMLRTGHAYELYDLETQRHFQEVLASPMFKDYGGKVLPAMLPFIHPSYEALYFIPLSLLSYKQAYFAFIAINLIALALSFWLLRPLMNELTAAWTWLPAAMFVSFVPTGVALMMGQDSLFLLFFFSAALVCLSGGSESWAGALAALACFKFQTAVPIAILFLCWRRWRFFGAFCGTGASLALLSVWITGVEQAGTYVRMLLSLDTGLAQAQRLELKQPVEKMANFRGLIHVALRGRVDEKLTTVIALVLSAALLFYVARAARSLSRTEQFMIAITSAVLVSYHMFKYDLAILLIPISLVLNETISFRGKRAWPAVLAAILFLAPALVSAYLLSIPLCLFVFLWLKNTAARPATTAAD